MTDAFWKWLTGLNPRRLFLALLALLVALAVWLVRQELQPPQNSSQAGADPGASALPQPSAPGLRALRNLPQREDPVGNPFTSPFLENALAVRRELGDFLERAPDALLMLPAAEALRSARNESQFLPLPPVELVYRGMMRRTDGVNVAFIDNQTTSTRTHYRENGSLLGYRIVEITRAQVILDDGRGTRRILPVNEVQVLREAAP